MKYQSWRGFLIARLPPLARTMCALDRLCLFGRSLGCVLKYLVVFAGNQRVVAVVLVPMFQPLRLCILFVHVTGDISHRKAPDSRSFRFHVIGG